MKYPCPTDIFPYPLSGGNVASATPVRTQSGVGHAKHFSCLKPGSQEEAKHGNDARSTRDEWSSTTPFLGRRMPTWRRMLRGKAKAQDSVWDRGGIRCRFFRRTFKPRDETKGGDAGVATTPCDGTGWHARRGAYRELVGRDASGDMGGIGREAGASEMEHDARDDGGREGGRHRARSPIDTTGSGHRLGTAPVPWPGHWRCTERTGPISGRGPSTVHRGRPGGGTGCTEWEYVPPMQCEKRRVLEHGGGREG